MDYKEFKLFFEKCGGKIVEKRFVEDPYSSSYSSRYHHRYRDRIIEEFVFPEAIDLSVPIYMEIVDGPKPRHGAICRFDGFVVEQSRYSSNCRPDIRVVWDDRDKSCIESYYFFKVLDEDYFGGTKWVWKTEKKKDIPAPRNKYGQELEIGGLVVGMESGGWKTLRFGYITRYTAANIWIKPIHFRCDGKKEEAEIRLDSIKQTCLFQEDFLEHLLEIKLMS